MTNKKEPIFFKEDEENSSALASSSSSDHEFLKVVGVAEYIPNKSTKPNDTRNVVSVEKCPFVSNTHKNQKVSGELWGGKTPSSVFFRGEDIRDFEHKANTILSDSYIKSAKLKSDNIRLNEDLEQKDRDIKKEKKKTIKTGIFAFLLGSTIPLTSSYLAYNDISQQINESSKNVYPSASMSSVIPSLKFNLENLSQGNSPFEFSQNCDPGSACTPSSTSSYSILGLNATKLDESGTIILDEEDLKTLTSTYYPTISSKDGEVFNPITLSSTPNSLALSGVSINKPTIEEVVNEENPIVVPKYFYMETEDGSISYHKSSKELSEYEVTIKGFEFKYFNGIGNNGKFCYRINDPGVQEGTFTKDGKILNKDDKYVGRLENYINNEINEIKRLSNIDNSCKILLKNTNKDYFDALNSYEFDSKNLNYLVDDLVKIRKGN